jgi:hypothetical protein
VRDGWYRVAHPLGRVRVLKIEANGSDGGSVAMMHQQGCIFEEVEVLNREQLDQRINDALKHKLESLQYWRTRGRHGRD